MTGLLFKKHFWQFWEFRIPSQGMERSVNKTSTPREATTFRLSPGGRIEHVFTEKIDFECRGKSKTIALLGVFGPATVWRTGKNNCFH